MEHRQGRDGLMLSREQHELLREAYTDLQRARLAIEMSGAEELTGAKRLEAVIRQTEILITLCQLRP